MASSNDPQNIDEHNWYYEEKKGISIIHEVIRHGKVVQSDEIVIPWKKLKQSLIRAGWVKA